MTTLWNKVKKETVGLLLFACYGTLITLLMRYYFSLRMTGKPAVITVKEFFSLFWPYLFVMSISPYALVYSGIKKKAGAVTRMDHIAYRLRIFSGIFLMILMGFLFVLGVNLLSFLAEMD